LVELNEIDTLSTELEDRLDDLFGENDIHLPDTSEKELEEQYPLAELKNLILSIDWEITDEVLNNLLQQLKDLQLTYEADKIVATFLQILNSLTKYIKTHRAMAHPKTFKTLNSVFASLDKVVLAKDMAEPAKKKILRTEMNRYKELRAQIAKSKSAAAQRTPKGQPAPANQPEINEKKEEPGTDLPEASKQNAVHDSAPPASDLQAPVEPAVVAADDDVSDSLPGSPHQMELASLTEAVEEIKRFIRTEVAALREEIRSIGNQQP
jgi:hypothetical protein